MELKAGDLSKILIFAFILLVGLVGTYLEFRKPKESEDKFEVDQKRINKEILEELEKNENSNI
ncbi:MULTISPECIES: hypothetical protein [Nitratiruptor]|uniref:Uncharacterized protein n=1 Tax=Nitratiruptor tergarcus DSM 16512 TaxID=1069081 RepID=A0A1W1WTL2_9BACT|nr:MULTISPECIES: hypothetical protein [Nitratiruptor]BCD61960.1 hypothetical protein NitYY0813_C0825 [Nitratiruptor sp. YY08-13]BCD65895.1 hypothetical protein NitYY0826_C0827 [Nitratiruptor sp. YY08-26]SMC09390.1 hypothetical protein SAMN05660197_1197 [Nitratiruptor tergarcus DSM 16512]